jgi:hypothetical protein
MQSLGLEMATPRLRRHRLTLGPLFDVCVSFSNTHVQAVRARFLSGAVSYRCKADELRVPANFPGAFPNVLTYAVPENCCVRHSHTEA